MTTQALMDAVEAYGDALVNHMMARVTRKSDAECAAALEAYGRAYRKVGELAKAMEARQAKGWPPVTRTFHVPGAKGAACVERVPR